MDVAGRVERSLPTRRILDMWTLRVTFAGLFAILAWPATCLPAETADSDALRQAVTCAEIDFALSVEAGDKAAFAEFIHPDARFVGGGISRGRDAVVAAWAPFFKENGPQLAWRPMIVEVLDSGELALTRGPYRLRTTTEDGVEVEQWGTFNSTWQRQPDGRWQVVFDAGSPAAVEFPPEIRLLILEPAGACETS
jgi:ketosteroid isomerase-like protein